MVSSCCGGVSSFCLPAFSFSLTQFLVKSIYWSHFPFPLPFSSYSVSRAHSQSCVCVCVLIIGLSEVNACACCEAKKSLSFNLAYINTRTQTLILSVLLLFFLLVLFLVIALYCTEHRSNIVTEMLTHSSPQNWSFFLFIAHWNVDFRMMVSQWDEPFKHYCQRDPGKKYMVWGKRKISLAKCFHCLFYFISQRLWNYLFSFISVQTAGSVNETQIEICQTDLCLAESATGCISADPYG